MTDFAPISELPISDSGAELTSYKTGSTSVQIDDPALNDVWEFRASAAARRIVDDTF